MIGTYIRFPGCDLSPVFPENGAGTATLGANGIMSSFFRDGLFS